MISKPTTQLAGDGYEPEVTDLTLGREIELLADVIAAAGQVDGRLTTVQLDQALASKPGTGVPADNDRQERRQKS